MGRVRAESQSLQPPPPPPWGCLPRTASSPTRGTYASDDTNLSSAVPSSTLPIPDSIFLGRAHQNPSTYHNLELQLLPMTSNSSAAATSAVRPKPDGDRFRLRLSIGSSDFEEKSKVSTEESRLAMVAAEKECAEEERRRARRQLQLAELEFENAKKIREEAQAELGRAKVLMDRIHSTLLQVTCRACEGRFRAGTTVPRDDRESWRLDLSCVSEGEVENENDHIINPGDDVHANKYIAQDDLQFNYCRP